MLRVTNAIPSGVSERSTCWLNTPAAFCVAFRGRDTGNPGSAATTAPQGLRKENEFVHTAVRKTNEYRPLMLLAQISHVDVCDLSTQTQHSEDANGRAAMDASRFAANKLGATNARAVGGGRTGTPVGIRAKVLPGKWRCAGDGECGGGQL